MSLTSYRAAPPRVRVLDRHAARTSDGLDGRQDQPGALCPGGWRIWRRPTLPRLKTQYHWRGGFSRPSSGWDRGQAPRYDHQIGQPCGSFEKGYGDGGAGEPARIFLRKEVIQPQVPLRLPCYDFTPVADLTVVGCLSLPS